MVAWLATFGSHAWLRSLAICFRCSPSPDPMFRKEEIVYQEFFASGASRKNILTKLGGARNCLRLLVTRDFLWVTSWFPFSIIAPVYDLEHIVPLRV